MATTEPYADETTTTSMGSHDVNGLAVVRGVTSRGSITDWRADGILSDSVVRHS
jgi:hypothetical protein